MDELPNTRRTWLIGLGLALAILAAYSPLWHCQFVLFDDNEYVTDNPIVKQGLTWPGIVWAFSTTHASNWHPLTWISHMLDCQCYQLNAAGHHASSLFLHIANSILLFLLLRRLTREEWPSAVVAALFALHPLHVESVAWISERKDVLSGLFWMLTVWAYVRYAQEKSIPFYLASLALFALGLMAKPMLVTLPFVLLLLDIWPLQRWRPPLGRLIVEKGLFFILAALSCDITVFAQRRGGAVASLASDSLGLRVANVPIAYARYLGKTFWPSDLAVLYPLPRQWPMGEVAAATALLLALTAWVILRRRTQPWLAVGWFWFLGVLLPVIGLLHVGSQAMADRYDYLPGIGLFIAVVWTARAWRFAKGAVAVALAGCLLVTWTQVHYWQDSESLFRHALDATSDNGFMENDLGKVLLTKDQVDEALPHLQRAAGLIPRFPLAHYNLGRALLAKGQVAEALSQFETQVALAPNDPLGQYNFGATLLDHGLAVDAIPHLENAARLRPADADYRRELGDACRQAGHAAEAMRQYQKSLDLAPANLPAASSLAWMLATNPRPALRNGARALQLAQQADQASNGHDPRIIGIVAAAYAELGDFPRAVATAQRALSLAAAGNQTALAGALRQQLEFYRQRKPFRG